MTIKPVEVWCGLRYGEVTAVFLTEQKTILRSFPIQRRLLVKEGETFDDGVEACIRFFDSDKYPLTRKPIQDGLRALSPQKEVAVGSQAGIDAITRGLTQPKQDEATELLREARDLIGSQPTIERYERTINKQFTDRIDTYLKERG